MTLLSSSYLVIGKNKRDTCLDFGCHVTRHLQSLFALMLRYFFYYTYTVLKTPFLSIFQGFLPFTLPITPLKDCLMLLIADVFAPPNVSLMGESCEEQLGACGSRLRSVGTFLPRKLLTRVSKSLSGGNMTTDLRLVRIVGCIVRALALSSHCDARS